MGDTMIHEAAGGIRESTGEKILVRLIDAGQGSSGQYPPEVLEAAVNDGVFPAGTRMFVDHPTVTEGHERPERSIRDLAAETTGPATWDPATNSVVAEARVFSPWRAVIAEMHTAIGVSIRGAAEIVEGVVQRITHIASVDFVTEAGRGGAVLSILESQRAVAESLASDLRDQIRRALPKYAAIEDFDPDTDTVIYGQWDDTTDRYLYYRDTFTRGTNTVTLTGNPVEVRHVSTFVPVSAGPQPTTESQGGTMPQISEARLAELTEAAETAKTLTERVTALEAERDTAITERDGYHSRAIQHDARTIMTEQLAESQLPTAAQKRLIEGAYPVLTTDGDIDHDATRTECVKAIEAEAKYLSEATTAHIPGSFGASTPATEGTRRTHDAWGTPIRKGA